MQEIVEGVIDTTEDLTDFIGQYEETKIDDSFGHDQEEDR